MIKDISGATLIDTLMHGKEAITGVYLLDGEPRVIIETGPGSSFPRTLEGLREAGVDSLDFIILTHIHLDHAGAVGHFAREFPEAKVVVRQEGAPHLIDPSRLWASAGRLYPNMELLWGEMIPVPEKQIRPIGSDELLVEMSDGRRLESLYTPGHANHHMAIFERKSGDAFVGDAIGVALPDAGAIRPATPPPEFNLEVAVRSIEKIRSLRPSRVIPTHFGPTPDPQAALDEGAERMRQWVSVAEEVFDRGGDIDATAEEFKARRGDLYPGLSDEVLDRLERTTSYKLNASGIVRYLTKRSESSNSPSAS